MLPYKCRNPHVILRNRATSPTQLFTDRRIVSTRFDIHGKNDGVMNEKIQETC